MKSWLIKFAKQFEFTLHIEEVDIARSSDQDLSADQLWNKIFHDISTGVYDVAILSPPCNTFSRARHKWRTSPGPRPLRSRSYLWGFPWLSFKNKTEVSLHNMFIKRSVQVAKSMHLRKAGYLFEHPEDLGAVDGEHPASIWQWQEIINMCVQCEAFSFALYQCQFGAGSPKPTRLLSNLIAAGDAPFQGLPQFDEAFNYTGPLPSSCKHSFHVKRLIGKVNGKWATSPAAAYPPSMCRFLAELVMSYLRRGVIGHDIDAPGPLENEVTQVAESSAPLKTLPQVADESDGLGDGLGKGGKPLENVTGFGRGEKRFQETIHR